MSPDTSRRFLLHTGWPGNLVGALVVYAYFRFVDHYAFPPPHAPAAAEIAYFVVGFGGLILAGYALVSRWNRPLEAPPPPPAGPAGDLTRRRALQFPYVVAIVTAVGWILAGVIWGVGLPLLSG